MSFLEMNESDYAHVSVPKVVKRNWLYTIFYVCDEGWCQSSLLNSQ